MHQKPEASSELIKKFVVDGLQEIKGENITIMDLRDIENAVTDFFVIEEGNSNTQVNALGEPRDAVGVFARRLVSQADKDFLSKLTPQSTENLIQALADTRVDPMRTMLGNFDLNPIVAIKVFERALDMARKSK